MPKAHDKKLTARLYHSMQLIRRVEEKIAEVYFTDVIKSPVHLSIGQESVAVGVCDALAADDLISNTYRCHATYLAKGGDLNEMMAELYGKKGGCAGGKAGSMHLIDMPHGVMGASAVVGTTIPVAAGYAMALKWDAKKTGKQRIVVAMFGDGATEEGVFAETINFAALHKLPVIFVCENNRLAIHTPLEKRWATEKLLERIHTYDIPTHYIPDADVFKIREVISNAAVRVRQGKGPVFVQCDTYRWKEHVGPGEDFNQGYRNEKEFKKWLKSDQVARLGKMLGSEKAAIDKQVEKEIAAAVAFAEKSPFPGKKELMQHVHAA